MKKAQEVLDSSRMLGETEKDQLRRIIDGEVEENNENEHNAFAKLKNIGSVACNPNPSHQRHLLVLDRIMKQVRSPTRTEKNSLTSRTPIDNICI